MDRVDKNGTERDMGCWMDGLKMGNWELGFLFYFVTVSVIRCRL